MQAITFEQTGDPSVLTITDIPAPIPKEHELLVRVHACGLNRADLLQRKGKYSAPAGESTILGLEIAGEVCALGKNVKNFVIGQRVFGLVAGGAYAEYCCIDSEMALTIPDKWDYVKAAAIPEVFFTANETIFELGELKTGETILIHAGASGVGSTAIQMAKYIGATVYFTAGSDEKIAKVLALGADAGINYKTHDFCEEILRLTQNQGVAVIEDFIGGNYFSQNLRCLAPAGRLIIVAFMTGALAEIDLSLILRKRLQIKGSILRSQSLAEKRKITQRFVNKWLSILIAGKIQPIIDSVFPFTEVRQAHERMEKNLNFGKIILTF